ncbi:DUF3488 and transglutaminase-like domain-containing protein [Streptomyces sp. CAU 1734]|uniref:transglutaminase TgpA family protein n=1 Tax=Streptomyces sp. CAU 1734 TaxID=3140360 RepID=UPI0032617DB1
MSGRGRLALCAYAATLMAASAILPLLETVGWLVLAAFLLGIQSGAGALARRIPLARPLTVLAQLAVGVLLLALVFARDKALFGLVPGPETFQRLAEVMSEGGHDIGRYAIPAPATDGIRLLVVTGVLVIGLLVDVLAVTYRSAAPAGLPLLALYSVAAGLAGGGTSWLWFLLAACGYLMLLLAEGRDRLSRWGRVFGAPAARAGGAGAFERAGSAPLAPGRSGRRIGALALGVALAVPAALPALDGGVLDGMGGGQGSGGGNGSTISAVNPLVSLQDNLNQPDDREVLRYRTDSAEVEDLYLRIVALDQFDGTTWKSSPRDVRDVPDRLPPPEGLAPGVDTAEITTKISAADYYRQSWLPLPYPATAVKIGGRWRFEPSGRTLVGDAGEDSRGAEYEVTSLQVKPTPAQLAGAPPARAAVQSEYTKVPDDLPAMVEDTALQVTAGARNDYERAVRLQDWFARDGGFTYDTRVRSGTGVNAITRFLQRKEGFCIHFSFSMAAMARTLGIPARVAVGFTPGSPLPDGTMSVGLNDAHAWPELYFEGVGWTRFEPTPSRGSAPEYTAPEAAAGGPTSPAVSETNEAAERSAAPAPSDSCPAELRRLNECGAAAPQEVAEESGSGGPGTGPLLIGLGVLVAWLTPLLPMVWRKRVTARRLGSRGRTAEDSGARTLAAWRELCDTAWDHGITPDESRTARQTAARIVLLGKLADEPAEAVNRVADAVEQVLYSPVPTQLPGVAEDVRRARAGLSAGAGRGARLRALLLPRSAIRVIWGISERWAALNDRRRSWGRARWDALMIRRPFKQRG